MARRDISLRCAIWSLSGHSGLWQADRPADLWVHGLDAAMNAPIALILTDCGMVLELITS